MTAHFVILLANSNLFKSSQGVDKGDYLEYVLLCFFFQNGNILFGTAIPLCDNSDYVGYRPF